MEGVTQTATAPAFVPICEIRLPSFRRFYLDEVLAWGDGDVIRTETGAGKPESSYALHVAGLRIIARLWNSVEGIPRIDQVDQVWNCFFFFFSLQDEHQTIASPPPR